MCRIKMLLNTGKYIFVYLMVYYPNYLCLSLTEEDVEIIDNLVESFMECKNIPGLGLSIVKDGDAFEKGYGFANIKTKEKFDRNTISCIGSTGKAFTVVLLGILLGEITKENKTFNWNTNIRDILGDDFKFSDDFRTSDATLIDILTHRTGLMTTEFLMLSGFPNENTTRGELISRLRFLPSRFKFRDRFLYDNLMYMLAGHIAEKIGGNSYEKLIEEKILKPLGMNSATFIDDIMNRPESFKFARPYRLHNMEFQESDPRAYMLRIFAPAGGLCASPSDLTKWLKFLLYGGRTDEGAQLIDHTVFSEVPLPRMTLSEDFQNYFTLKKPLPVVALPVGYGMAWIVSNYRGLAIAVVKDGEVYTKGYGFADLQTGRLFDNTTVSCIGSTSKAITVALLGILLTEMKSTWKKKEITWNMKVKEILGDSFKLEGGFRTDEITLLDILSHRTGLGTTDYLMQAVFPNVNITRKGLSGRLQFLPESAPFRDQFIYNNIMYMLVGYVAEVLGRKSYEDLVKQKIFEPLGMKTAVFIDNIFETENIAKPYQLINDTLHDSFPSLYKLKNFSPAGGVCASATDLTKWLKFMLSTGKTTDGKQLIQRSLFSDIFKPHVVIPLSYQNRFSLYKPFPVIASTSWYGLGWFGSNYRGYDRMFHGGNFHSYSAQATVFPKEKFGFFISLNGPWPISASKTYLQLSHYLSDILLKENTWLDNSTICTYPEPWGNKGFTITMSGFPDFRPIADMEEYIGNFGHPLYGDLSVTVRGDNLYLSVGLLMNGFLRPVPNADNFFVLDLEMPLSTILSLPTNVNFRDKKSDKYCQVNLVFSFGAEVYKFYRNVKFSDNNLGQGKSDASNKCSAFYTENNVFITIILLAVGSVIRKFTKV